MKKHMFFKAFCAGNFAVFLILVSLFAFQTSVHAESFPSGPQSLFSIGGTIEITVQGEDNLSGSYYIDHKGKIEMPLIGAIHVAGKNMVEIRKTIAANLGNGFIKNPVVSIKAPSVASSQPLAGKNVYVVGEIKNPGYYTLPSNAAHLLNIVALAGGYTSKADKQEFEIVRNIKGVHYRKKAQSGALEYIDGDIIVIKERF